MPQTRWEKSTEATEVEYSAIDKGAITAPTPNMKAQAALIKAETDADRIDYVEWPTAVHGQENQGI